MTRFDNYGCGNRIYGHLLSNVIMHILRNRLE